MAALPARRASPTCWSVLAVHSHEPWGMLLPVYWQGSTLDRRHPASHVRGRRRRYASIVVALLTPVFVGVATVVSVMTTTTFRPLPFAEPATLVQFAAGG